jgi:DNA-binding SARP family transcriptional activator/pimeloyl-ACP methyl ester carboxylesterase
MTQLSIRLLGGFRAQHGSGRPLAIRRKKAQALLAYLALHPGQARSRDSLAGLLWSGTTDEHARHNLRQTLFALRQAVGPASFLVEGELVGLRESALNVDIAAFERGVERGTPDALREATGLYRGELLDGLRIDETPFDDWLAAERQRLRELALTALEKLLAMDVAAGAVETAVATALRLLALDPLRESVHRTLMDLYVRQGRRTAALRQYQQCAEVLRRELGVEPEAATSRRFHEIQGDAPERDRGRLARPTPAAALPTTCYVRSGDVNLAYQVIGDGPPDLVLVPGWVSNVECFWEEPRVSRFLRRLAAIGRLILFDKRGTGLSDRVRLDALPTLEQRMTDVRAVMDAVGSERATLVGYSEGGTMCTLFAATYPDRAAGLVMIGSYARRYRAPDHPWGLSPEDDKRSIERLWREWGGPIGLEHRAPSAKSDEAFSRWWARFLRMSASPGAAVALAEMTRNLDVRHVLPAIRVPTLILHAVGDRTVDVRYGRYMAARIPHARYVELPGADHLPWLADADAIVAEIERLVAASDPATEPDRVLVTVMAAELAPSRGNGAARHAASRGDAFRDSARAEVLRCRGRVLSEAGPTILATFDGPARAVRCATAIVEGARRLGTVAKAGLHTGECDVHPEGLRGSALDVARRVAAVAKGGDVVVSATVKDLIAGSGIEFVPRGGLAAGRAADRRPLFAAVSRAGAVLGAGAAGVQAQDPKMSGLRRAVMARSPEASRAVAAASPPPWASRWRRARPPSG